MKKITAILFAWLCTNLLLSASDTEYLNRDGWTWLSSSICEPEQDITGLEGLYDGESSTCWHTNYHAASGTPERANPHWIMIDRGTDSTPFYGISYLPRQSQLNTHCFQYMVYFRDEDMSDTPATSVDDIKAILGEPDLEGLWEQNYNEKLATTSKASTARYVLFVNAASYSSNSAACAEFNLLAHKQAIPGMPNAVKITPIDGSEPHRIAIDGTNLNISMAGSYIHMSNSGITIEYTPEEVSYFSFEQYTFDENTYYVGSKSDIYDNPFDMAVTPEAGELTELTEISITAAIGALPTVNPSATGNVTLRRGRLARRTISPARMPNYATENAYVIGNLTDTVPGEYTLTIPEGFFIDAAECRNRELTVVWNLLEQKEPEVDAIEEVTTDCPTITFRRDGNDLIVGGITLNQYVTLTNLSGIIMAKVPVSGHGIAIIPLESLAHGVYLLNANNKTIKLTI